MTTLVLTVAAMAGFLSPPVGAADLPLQTPAGWTSTKQEGTTVFTPGDLAEGTIYAVMATPLSGTAGSLAEIFTRGKSMLAEAGTFSAAMEPKPVRSEGGWECEFAIGPVTKDGRSFLAQVTAVRSGGRGGVLLVLADGAATMERHSGGLAGMLRTLGATAAPAIAPAPGKVDLRYAVPAGWTESWTGGFPRLEKSQEDFYTKFRVTLLVLPTEPLDSGLRAAFVSHWRAYVDANYQTTVTPLPLMARLKSGYACAFDADTGARNKNGDVTTAALYLLAHGGRVVPILGIFFGHCDTLEKDLGQFLQTARIPGTTTATVPLFAASEVAGDWNDTSTAMANYVSSSGAYAGDASITTGDWFHLRADGTYDHVLMALTRDTRLKERDEGTWTVDDDELVLEQAKGRSTYTLLGYGVDPKAGRSLVVAPYSNRKAGLPVANPRCPNQATWLKSR